MARNWTEIDVNDLSGVAAQHYMGISCSLAGEGEYKKVQPNGKTIKFSVISSNPNYKPIEKGVEITNTDDSAVAADLLYFINWG